GGEELIGIGICWHEHARLGRRDARVAPRIMVGQWIMPEQRAVVAAEPIVPIVARAPLLRQSRGWLEFPLIGAQSEIAAANVDLLAAGHAVNPAADQPVGAIHPVVQPKTQTVDARLIVFRGKTAEQLL